MKRPSFQFYPADWRNDAALRMCSLAARGLWWEMICIMHMAEPYGHLVAAGNSIDVTELARIVGESRRDVQKWLNELSARKIFSVTESGLIYSRRMIRDETERLAWAKRQRKHRDVTPYVTPDVTESVTSMSQLSASASASASASSNPAVDGTPDINAGANGSHGRVETSKTASKTEGWSTPVWVAATAKTLGMERRNGETDADFADRVHTEVNARQRKADAETRRRQQLEIVQRLAKNRTQ